jgi:hypothetical protein
LLGVLEIGSHYLPGAGFEPPDLCLLSS